MGQDWTRIQMNEGARDSDSKNEIIQHPPAAIVSDLHTLILRFFAKISIESLGLHLDNEST